MTREENLHWIDQEIQTWENECQSKHPIKEALYAARKVLERELNTWSLDDAREDFMYDVYNILDFLPTNDEANRIIDSFDMVTKGIKQEPRWIPVAEKLPEDSHAVLVWCPERKNIYCAYREVNQWWIFGAYFEKVTFKVIAWMPLPNSYKKESEK